MLIYLESRLSFHFESLISLGFKVVFTSPTPIFAGVLRTKKVFYADMIHSEVVVSCVSCDVHTVC